jgi:hypothetical protein
MEVLSGLWDGDLIVTAGVSKITDSLGVRIGALGGETPSSDGRGDS